MPPLRYSRQAEVVAEQEIGVPVSVDVPQREGRRDVHVGGQLSRRVGERARPVAQVEPVLLERVPEQEIEVPVTVHVSGGDGSGVVRVRRQERGRVEKHPDPVVAEEAVLLPPAVRQHGVEVAVPVHVPQSGRPGVVEERGEHDVHLAQERGLRPGGRERNQGQERRDDAAT